MRRNRASLFLLELILSIFIFLCCAGVCVSLFWSSHSMSRRSRELAEATFQTQAAAEIWKKDGMPGIGSLGAAVDGNKARLYYNSDWEPCSEAQAGYVLFVDCAREGSLSRASLRISALGEADVLYELETASFKGVDG